MRGDIIWNCSQCLGDVVVSVPNIREAVTSLVANGRYDDLSFRMIHECDNGELGMAEFAKGMPTPMEGEPHD